MSRTSAFLLSLCLASSLIVTTLAGGPVFWRVNTRAEIEKGDAEGVSIADNGALTLAPAFTAVFDTKQAYVWSVAADAAGNVYLGTGHEGRVFKVDPSGKGSLLYKTGELDVMALAVDAGGNVYAGTAPDGKIYRITPQGEAKVFFEPKTKYIWSLAFDQQGRLLVGTGDKGVIYRVTPDGKGAPLINTTQTSITALKVDAAGAIIAGTDPGGLVLRITPDGKAFTLFDSSQREVRDLALGKDGDIYALTVAESAGGGAGNTAPSAPAASAPIVVSADEGVTVTITDMQILGESGGTGSATSSSPRNAGDQAKSALYRIDSSGVTDVLWDSREITAFALALNDQGRALVGTGQKGRIYSVAAADTGIRNPALLAQSTEAQTSRFVKAGSRIYAASSNLGKLFRLGSETVSNGSYTSSVRDAQTVGTWGRIAWNAEGEVELQTRSGNTAAPDSTWSDWSQPYRAAEGGRDGAAIVSPRARFIQWRATLRKTGQVTPRLREVTVSYLPRNVAPSINSLSLLPVGVALQALPQQQPDGAAEQAGLDPAILGASVQIPPRKLFQRGAVSLQWTAEDRNGDSLEYALYYRNATGGEWFPLKTGMKDNYYTIDANALPDGRYVFKVVASDAPSNPGGVALTDEQETEPIEVDNTAPTVTADAPSVIGARAEAVFRANDATSIIRRAEYQLDGGQWRAVFPVDGIADSRREDFKVIVTLPDAKPHIIAFRVFDANANVGSGQATVSQR
jgi:sugar lactone lactonase YvrE